MRYDQTLPVAIIGAGPIGLAAAAHLSHRNIPFLLFEAGKNVGANIRTWGHVTMFSPWKYTIDAVAEALLRNNGWSSPNKEALPTGHALIENYLEPLSCHFSIAPHLHLDTRVISVGRLGMDKMKDKDRSITPFELKVNERGTVQYYQVRAVMDASGTWNQPNPIGSCGLFAKGEEGLSDRITYGIPDLKGNARERYAHKNVLVVGSGHAAIQVLLELAEVQREHPKTQIHWALRKGSINKVYGGQTKDALKGRGALGIRIEKLVNSGKLHIYTDFFILQLASSLQGLTVRGKRNGAQFSLDGMDEIICNTGSRPDMSLAREVRLALDPSLEAVSGLAHLINPNIHSCGTVRPHGEKELRHPEQNYYIVGAKSYGRAPTFLLATGYEQVRSIVAYLDGDFEAAKRLELNLPKTGVCHAQLDTAITTCCEKPSSSEERKVAVTCCV